MNVCKRENPNVNQFYCRRQLVRHGMAVMATVKKALMPFALFSLNPFLLLFHQ